MQDATAAFDTAVTKGEVTWSGPTVLADWLGDGPSELTGRPSYSIDLFDRVSQSTWGRPTYGRSSYVQLGDGADADFLVSPNGYGQHRHAVRNANRISLVEAGTSVMTVKLVWSVDSIFTGTGESFIEVNAQDDGTGSNRYGFRMETDAADATADLVLTRVVAGVADTLDFVLDHFVQIAGHRYALVFQVTPEFVRGKAWDTDVETEPLEWLLSTDVVTASFSPVYGGVRSRLHTDTTNTLPFYFNYHELRVIDGSIDDLSDLVGQIIVTQTIDDGLPDEVSFVADLGVAQMDAQIVDGRSGLRASQYLSSHNPASPLYGLDRDVAPVTLDHGVVTADGPELVRLFTGQMTDLPVARDKLGHLVAESQTRLKLSRLVQPPPFNRLGDLSASWPISWAAYQCGVYAAPPPTDRCIFYAPLHGSMQPFVDANQPDQASYRGVFANGEAGYYRDIGGGEIELITFGDNPELAPPYVDGPYVAAPDLRVTTEVAWGMYYNPMLTAFTEEPHILSETGPRGRFEFAVRGDAWEATLPSGADFTPQTFILGLLIQSDSGGSQVYCGIALDGELRVELSDGTDTISADAGADYVLPADGLWHKYGVAWDFVTETVYFYHREPDGTEHETSVTNAALDVTRLPTTDEVFGTVEPFNTVVFPEQFSPHFFSFIPCAELRLTGGVDSNPTSAPWVWEDAYGFTASAIIKRSANRLRVIAEPTEREAYELIGIYAQAEVAAVRIDELDRLLYLTPQYWVEEAQQAETQTLSTLAEVGELTPQIDPSKTRNMVRVAYPEIRIDRLYAPMYQSREVLALPPGTSTILIPLDVLTTEIDTALATLPSAAQIALGVSGFLGTGSWNTFFTINTAPDGTGTYLTGPGSNPFIDPIYIQALDVFTASVVSVEVVNQTASTVYTANTNPEVPTINIGGIGAYPTDASVIYTREESIAKRGTRGLTVNQDMIQRREDAQRLAQRLIADLADPSPTLEGVRLFGDQRRQPGDLVTFDDARDTAVSGLWRILGIRHVINGADYYQETRLRKALSVGEWQESGTSRWGTALWGREGL